MRPSLTSLLRDFATVAQVMFQEGKDKVFTLRILPVMAGHNCVKVCM